MKEKDMANQMVKIHNYPYLKEVSIKKMGKLSNNKSNMAYGEIDAENPQSSYTSDWVHFIWRTGRLQSRQKHSRTDYRLQKILEKHIKQQTPIKQNYIDFRKAFNSLWHQGLWKVMSDHNVNLNTIKLMKSLYQNAEGAVIISGDIEWMFRTMVGVCQGYIFSTAVFNQHLENIIKEPLEDFSHKASVGGRKSVKYILHMTSSFLPDPKRSCMF